MNVFADRELVELLAGRADLLALADAVAETQRARRRVSRRAAAVFVVAAAAAAVAVVMPWHGHGTNVVGRALAAVGTGPVVHAIVENASPNDVLVNVATGETRQRVHRTEYWYDEERHALHTRLSTDGVQITEIVETPTHAWSDVGDFPTHDYVPQLDRALAGFATGYRDALRNGTAKAVGETQIDGRPAKLIDIEVGAGRAVEHVAVDAKTFEPLRFHSTYPGGRDSAEWRVVTLESLPRDPAYFAHPPLSPPRPTAGSASAARPIPLAAVREHLGRAPVWLGETFAGAPVDSVEVERHTAELTDGTTVEGVVVRISYGDVRVSQAADRAGAYALGLDDGGDPAPPNGWIAANEDPGGRTHWQGELQRESLSIVLDAPTREQLLAAARALTELRE